MGRDLADQVAAFVEVLDRQAPPITVDELVEASTVDLVPSPRRRPNGLLVATAVAVVLILVVGGLALFMNTSRDIEPAVTTLGTPTTTGGVTPTSDLPESSGDPLPKADGTIIEWSGNPGVFAGEVGPLGPVAVEYTSVESTFIPAGRLVFSLGSPARTRAYGGIVETPDGYTALGVARGTSQPALATSADGISWEIITFTPDIRFGDSARLFEAGGWYWIGLNEPHIYRSPDSISWERIDLGGSSPMPMGGPIADQRWHEFGGRLVAPAGDGLITVDMDTGDVERFGRPWALPGGSGWWWMTAVNGKLTAFISTVADEPLTAEDAVVEQWETADLVTWDGPFQPAFANEETTGALVAGDSSTGLVAIVATPTQEGVSRYFSSDGANWREFITLTEAPNENLWNLIDQDLAPIRVDGQQGLALVIPRELDLTSDGGMWQTIALEGGVIQEPSGYSRAMVGNRMFIYEYQRREGEWLLDSWIVSIGE